MEVTQKWYKDSVRPEKKETFLKIQTQVKNKSEMKMEILAVQNEFMHALPSKAKGKFQFGSFKYFFFCTCCSVLSSSTCSLWKFSWREFPF